MLLNNGYGVRDKLFLIMTQEQKELLLRDLSARLPYGVKVNIPDLFLSTKNNIEVLNEIFCGNDNEFRCNDSGMMIKYVKPYLFPLSSMTEEIMDEIYSNTGVYDIDVDSPVHIEIGTTFEDLTKIVDILHKHHIDYQNLIEKGLAIDCSNLNIY